MVETLTDDIIRQAAQGNHQAFETIYRTYGKFVYNVAWRIVDRHEDASEVAQDVFVSIYKKLDQFNFESTLKTWIYRITINTAMNHKKRMAKMKNKTTTYDEQMHSTSVESAIDKKGNAEEHENLISILLNALNEEQRACVVLRNIEGLSYQEIADALDININTVRSRLSRARETLLRFREKVVTHEL